MHFCNFYPLLFTIDAKINDNINDNNNNAYTLNNT